MALSKHNIVLSFNNPELLYALPCGDVKQNPPNSTSFLLVKFVKCV